MKITRSNMAHGRLCRKHSKSPDLKSRILTIYHAEVGYKQSAYKKLLTPKEKRELYQAVSTRVTREYNRLHEK